MSKTKGFLNEFREFATKGSVIDLAVGVIVGGAFSTITKSLTDDIIMPIVSLFIGGINFSEWKLTLKEAYVDASAGELVPAVTLNYGTFLSVLINFIILAFIIFCMVKAINKARVTAEKKLHLNKVEEPVVEAAPPAPTSEELLADILKTLQNKQG